MKFKLLNQGSGQNEYGKFVRMAHIGQDEHKGITYSTYRNERGMVTIFYTITNSLHLHMTPCSLFEIPHELLKQITEDLDTCLANIDKY